MTENNISASTHPTRQFLPLLMILFFGSGCAALIYEIVWYQLLQLVIGSSAISLGVILGTFMGGMCLGSILLPRIISRRLHPLKVYALLELGIAICGLLILFCMPFVSKFYVDVVGHGTQSIMLRAVVAGICLILPTLLMGATLPAIARWVEMTPKGVSWLGFFYGGNIAGAMFGCLLAGFYLLRVYDTAIATYVAVVIDIVVTALGLLLASISSYQPAEQIKTAEIEEKTVNASSVYFTIALSGLCALAAEVVWTRLLSLTLGGTVYTFSIILAVFLFGLGIGSSIGSFMSAHTLRPRLALGTCQFLLTATVAWAGYAIARSLPYWPVDPSLTWSPWYDFHLDLMRCVWAVLPAAILWGASFPLALASVASGSKDPGRLVGQVYAANTIGAIIGAIGFSMIVIPLIGTQQAQRLMIWLSAASAIIMFFSVLFQSREVMPASLKDNAGRLTGVSIVSLAVLLGLSFFFAKSVSAIPWGVTAYGRNFATMNVNLVPGITPEKDVEYSSGILKTYCIYSGEGMNVSVAVTKNSNGTQYFHGAGKVQASTEPLDMRLQRMLGHISALGHKKPESVLVIACGAGVTAGTFVVHPDVKRIVICDIEPLVPTHVAPMFAKENYNVVADGRTQVVFDDGRHFIETTKEKFDIITSDPIDPWVKGCAALNTIEYYQMCKDHLNDGGLMTLWMPFYESNPQTAKSLIGTFFKVFPNGIIWSNDTNREGYDAVLFGQKGPTQINVTEWQQRLDRQDHDLVKQSLKDVGFNNAVDLLSTYIGQAPQLQDWAKDAQINTDRNLRLQYLAGLALNSNLSTQILNGILNYFSFPQDLFTGSDEDIQNLKQALQQAGRYQFTNTQSATENPGNN